MAGQKEPVELVVHKGKKHLTKAEIEGRLKSEVKAPSDSVLPPSYLCAANKKEFVKIAGQLIALEIMSNLDCDCLARYIQTKDKYLKYNKFVDKIIKDIDKGEIESLRENCVILEKYEGLRDRALKQCRAAASDLGLTISSRCKLVVPKAEAPKENKFTEKFGGAV